MLFRCALVSKVLLTLSSVVALAAPAETPTWSPSATVYLKQIDKHSSQRKKSSTAALLKKRIEAELRSPRPDRDLVVACLDRIADLSAEQALEAASALWSSKKISFKEMEPYLEKLKQMGKRGTIEALMNESLMDVDPGGLRSFMFSNILGGNPLIYESYFSKVKAKIRQKPGAYLPEIELFCLATRLTSNAQKCLEFFDEIKTSDTPKELITPVAAAYIAVGKPKMALELIERNFKATAQSECVIDPKNYWLTFFKAEALGLNGNHKESLSCYNSFLEAKYTPDLRFNAYLGMAKVSRLSHLENGLKYLELARKQLEISDSQILFRIAYDLEELIFNSLTGKDTKVLSDKVRTSLEKTELGAAKKRLRLIEDHLIGNQPFNFPPNADQNEMEIYSALRLKAPQVSPQKQDGKREPRAEAPKSN